jgi:histidyl-tRNA synthetase
LVFGADEMAAGNLSIKDLRNASTLQRTVALADWAQWAQSLQSEA